jgi:tripartite-type tricarboxylate transporter receptor subunit TctC
VVVENRGGASGSIGTLEAVRARPDGQTMLFATASTLGLYPLMVERPVFDPLRDLTPVSLVGAATVAFAVRPEVAVDLPGLVAAARARPGQLKYGSPGSGSYLHLAMEYFLRSAGAVDMLHIPYRGSAPAMTDLLGGHLDAISDTVATAIENHRAGRVRILAVATRARSPLLPETPSVAEALNLPGFEAAVWMAVMLPMGVAEPARARLAQAIATALAEPATRTELEQAGFVLDGQGDPDAIRGFMAAEQEKWRPVVRATGVRLE